MFATEKEGGMSVFRVEKNKDYTVISNYHLRDKNILLKAKGLLSQILSLPEDWDYTLKSRGLFSSKVPKVESMGCCDTVFFAGKTRKFIRIFCLAGN